MVIDIQGVFKTRLTDILVSYGVARMLEVGGEGGGGGLKVHSLAILTNCVLDFCSVYFFVFRWIIWLFVAWRLIVLCVRLFVCCLFYSFLSCVSLLFVS